MGWVDKAMKEEMGRAVNGYDLAGVERAHDQVVVGTCECAGIGRTTCAAPETSSALLTHRTPGSDHG